MLFLTRISSPFYIFKNAGLVSRYYYSTFTTLVQCSKLIPSGQLASLLGIVDHVVVGKIVRNSVFPEQGRLAVDGILAISRGSSETPDIYWEGKVRREQAGNLEIWPCGSEVD